MDDAMSNASVPIPSIPGLVRHSSSPDGPTGREEVDCPYFQSNARLRYTHV